MIPKNVKQDKKFLAKKVLTLKICQVLNICCVFRPALHCAKTGFLAFYHEYLFHWHKDSQGALLAWGIPFIR